jgi:phage terminase large subunit
MNINLSPKYLPLFDLLVCWDKISSKEFKSLPKHEQDYWNDLNTVDTVLMSGGRDSQKSFALSTFNVVASKDFNHRVLYTRQTMSSTDSSITEALELRMEMLNCKDKYNVSSNTYTLKDETRKGRITITGQKTSSGNQTAKLKSLEDFSIFETDEGEELESYEGWKKIKRSMRAKDVQALSIIAFNPPTREHWLYEVFWEDAQVEEKFNGVKDGILYIHTDYRDNYENLAEHNKKEYEELRLAHIAYKSLTHEEREDAPRKLKKQSEEYEHVVLGSFRNTAEGVIFDNWETGEFNYNLPLMCYGLDFGFSDEDAMVKVAIDESRKLIYVHEELYRNGIGTDDLADILIQIVGYQDMVIADAASPRLIKHIREKGVNIEKSRKGQGSVLRGIKTIQGYTMIVSKDSKNVIKSLSNYVWNNKRAGVPEHAFSHIPDAIRYAVMELVST